MPRSPGGRPHPLSRSPDGSTRDVTPPFASGFNVRTTVHEYGGGEYCVADGTVYFSNFRCVRSSAMSILTAR